MHDRRREVLEPIISEINPKAYEVQTVELIVELSDIFSSMFDLRYDEIKQKPKAPKKSEFDEMNSLGFKSINYSDHVLKIILAKEEKYEYL